MPSLPAPLARLSGQLAWLLPALALLGFSLGEGYRYLLGIMSLGGLYLLLRHPRASLALPGARPLGLLFLCLWLPMLASWPDGIDPGRTLGATQRYLGYPLAGLALLYLFRRRPPGDRLLHAWAGLALFWMADGLTQFFVGHDLVGHVSYQGRITGMFEGVRLGFVLAILSPLVFEALRRWSERHGPWPWLLLVPLTCAILLGGSRVSWLMFGLAGVAYLAYLRLAHYRVAWGRLFIVGVLALTLASLLVQGNDWLRQRFTGLAQGASLDYQGLNAATSLRLGPWRTAWAMFQDNPLNGVGVRAFGEAYAHYTPDPAAPAFTQPHLFILEIAAETGLLGLAGYALFLGLLLGLMRRALRQRPDAVPWGLAALLAALPISATLSFYANFMAGLIWLLTIAFLARLEQPPQKETATSP